MGSVRGLGQLEAAVMDAVWSSTKPMRVRQVQSALAGRDLAYTTVMTVMNNLFKKGWLTRELDGRSYLYRATAGREANIARLMNEVLGSSRDHDAAFMHFVEGISADDAESLGDALKRHGRTDRG